MFKKIGLKLICAISLATIMIMIIYGFINVQSETNALLGEVIQHSDQLSATVISSTRYEMLLNNRSHISEIIQTIGKQPFIHEVRIMNKEGITIYSSDTMQIGHIIDKHAEACYACHTANEPIERLPITERTNIYHPEPNSPRLLRIINAFYNEPTCWHAGCHVHPSSQTVLGVLDVTISLEAIDAQIEAAKMRMLLFTLSSILALSGVLWFFIRRWVDKPVTHLVQATKQVAAGNLNYIIPKPGKDELGILARSFNKMTQNLSDARFQLFQSDKMASLGRLAAGVAHEINNPLTGILTYSSYLLKRAKTDTEMKNDLSVIVNETKRTREIVKGLLDFARQSVPKKHDVEIKDIINRAIRVVENQLSMRHINLTTHFESQLPLVKVDENQIQQVFINLIVNAIDAMQENNGKLNISASRITLAPQGIAKIKKAVCPKGHSLMDTATKIDGQSSIKIKVRYGGNEGFINLDPTYDRNNNLYGIEINTNGHCDFFCPQCDISLINKKKNCPVCGSPTYYFEVLDKGIFQGCSKKGCNWQYWETIEKEGKKEYVEIKIADNGCGIDKKNLDKIFEPFFTTKGQKGTGLGLAVIWGIIDNHNGNISVKSEVGTGTTFTLRLHSIRNNL